MIKRNTNSAMKILNDREKEIITARRLNENPVTLEDLSKNIRLVGKNQTNRN